mmetsp:Transcript_19758/g.46874  ORF Transcript_19758/g.46874 Transcript_19758/m.46874 type:complete len:241 (+) Transcript_19758:2-724(+)
MLGGWAFLMSEVPHVHVSLGSRETVAQGGSVVFGGSEDAVAARRRVLAHQVHDHGLVLVHEEEERGRVLVQEPLRGEREHPRDDCHHQGQHSSDGHHAKRPGLGLLSLESLRRLRLGLGELDGERVRFRGRLPQLLLEELVASKERAVGRALRLLDLGGARRALLLHLAPHLLGGLELQEARGSQRLGVLLLDRGQVRLQACARAPLGRQRCLHRGARLPGLAELLERLGCLLFIGGVRG